MREVTSRSTRDYSVVEKSLDCSNFMGLPFEETVSWIDKWEEKTGRALTEDGETDFSRFFQDWQCKMHSASLTDQGADLLVFDC
jgi:hypothetical protein